MFTFSNFLSSIIVHLYVWSACQSICNSYQAKLPDLLENEQVRSLLVQYIEKNEIKSLDQLTELIKQKGVQISRRSLATYLPEIKVRYIYELLATCEFIYLSFRNSNSNNIFFRTH